MDHPYLRRVIPPDDPYALPLIRAAGDRGLWPKRNARACGRDLALHGHKALSQGPYPGSCIC
jgi:hypothetical protein